MGKKISIDFDTLLWSSNVWNSMYLYITNFKSRIYKATFQNLHDQKCILQQNLISSPTAKIFACNIVIKNYTNSTNILDSYSYLCKYMATKAFQTIHLELYLLSNSIENIYPHTYSKYNLLVITLILFALEPEFNAKQDKSCYLINVQRPNFIVSIVKTIIQEQNDRLYLKNLDLATYFRQISVTYLIMKLNICNTIANILKHKIHLMFSVILKKNYCASKMLQADNLDYQLSNTFCKFLVHLIFSEVAYLVSSLTFKKHLQNKTFKFVSVINYGSEVLIGHTNQTYLKLCFQLLSSIVDTKSIILSNTSSSSNFSFIGYYFVVNNNTFIAVEPSKDLQILLLKKINLLFVEFQSNSSNSLIKSINYILQEWGKYFIGVQARKVFALLDYLIYLKLRKWICRKHSNWSSLKIFNKYFFTQSRYFKPNNFTNNHLFYTKKMLGEQVSNCILLRLKDINNVNFIDAIFLRKAV